MDGIAVAAAVLKQLADHARAALPAECCGLLLGRDGRIEAARAARNASDEPVRRFLVDPADHFAAIRHARACGLMVTGAYHSHPVSPPVPSPTDLREGDESLVHLIVCPGGRPGGALIRAWKFDAGNFRELRLVPFA